MADEQKPRQGHARPHLIDPVPISQASLRNLPFLGELTEALRLLEADDPALTGSDVQKEVTSANLAWMLRHLEDNPNMPIDKQGRWIGFVQGVLAVRNVLSVAAERDRTRGAFHEAYRLAGLEVPASASMPES